MGSSVNTSNAVIVVGDEDTVGLPGLAENAAQHGAVIAEIFSFGRGEVVGQDDLTEVAAVVSAMSRAITTRTDLWVPFPTQDLGREQHVRRISMVLQRHGVNMLLGQQLARCTGEGGFSAIDFALRAEVKAVDDLDHAALAAGGADTLCAEIERELRRADHARHRPAPPAPPDVVVGEKCYGSAQVAAFFGKSVQWVDWGLRANVFTCADGSPIEPIRVGGRARRRRFTLPMLRDIAGACYRRGTLGEDELLNLLAVLARAEQE